MFYIGTSKDPGVVDLVSFYGKGKEAVTFYDASAGYLGFDCIRNGLLCDSRGAVWIAASERAVRFDPEKIQSDIMAPSVGVEDITFTGLSEEMDPIPLSHLKEDSTIQLPASMRNVRIHFHAIHHFAPEYIRYKYRLQGYEDRWSDETSERYASFTNLAPGKYTFEVQAKNVDGIWSLSPARVKLVLFPEFWQTLPLRLGVNSLVLLLVILIIYFIVNYFQKRKALRLSTQRQISELQLKTIRSQMDPHFTFNALNTISSVIYKEDKEKAYRYFTKFSRLSAHRWRFRPDRTKPPGRN